MPSPYSQLDARSFWKGGVAGTTPQTIAGLYRKKFSLVAADKVATAGSCFAQHIARYLRRNGFAVMDVEPPPPLLPEPLREDYGYNLYSARYGNIYTARQLLQLTQAALSDSVDPADVWEKDGRFFDALRPNIEPDGFDSVAETLENRRHHLRNVRKMLEEMDVFIFTFGLTEAWMNSKTRHVYPTAPGTIAGDFDPGRFEFCNFSYNDVYGDFVQFYELVHSLRPDVRLLLTVSPVPLTATASGDHVLTATTYSKSVLRSVAGDLAKIYPNIDYFPSYEIIAAPWSKGAFYEDNLRSVRPEGVAAVMRIFFSEHGAEASLEADSQPTREARRLERQRRRQERSADRASRSREKEICEDVLLEAFAR